MISQFFYEMEPQWREVLFEEFSKTYLLELSEFIEKERKGKVPIYPSQQNLFEAFWKTPFSQVKVVIVGQDPYHGPNQAHGLSFSVTKETPIPPSLKNVYKELVSDVHISYPKHGCLESWAKQGVFLLNALLTVPKNQPLAHKNKGWEQFTDAVLNQIVQKKKGVVFLLWGKMAQKKCYFLKNQDNANEHLFLLAAHPSPLSARDGFFGCCHFSKTNDWLEKKGRGQITWQI